jgi:hypothetical protein
LSIQKLRLLWLSQSNVNLDYKKRG